MTELDEFNVERGTGAWYSCSVVQNGIMIIFGGDSYFTNHGRQISIVESCRLYRIGQLPNIFDGGACNTFKTSIGEEYSLLCFSMDGSDECLRYSPCAIN